VVGYGMETSQRIMRFQRALSIGKRAVSLDGLALAAGYADRAHMIREFVASSGATPARTIARTTTTLDTPDFFKSGAAVEPTVRASRK
jgi:hypothetical protein